LLDRTAIPAWIVVGQDVKPKIVEPAIANGELL